jgi:hypothetical protein
MHWRGGISGSGNTFGKWRRRVSRQSGRFFEKKLSKKLLSVFIRDFATPSDIRSKSFWGAFFQKGALLMILPERYPVLF